MLTFDSILNNPKEYLFCYKSERSSIYTLSNKTLRASPIGTLNDPIENTLQTFFLDPDTRYDQKQIITNTNILKKITKKYCDNYIKIICLTQARDGTLGTLLSQSHMGYMRFSMWSQYADLGKGTCIIFNKKKIEKDFDQLLVKERIFGNKGDILYTDDFTHNIAFRFMYDEINSLKNGVNILKPKIQKYYKEYFFKKRIDWSNEHEYRFMIISDRIQNLDITNSVAGIVLGYNSNNDMKSVINNLSYLKDVPKVKIMLQGFHAYIDGNI